MSAKRKAQDKGGPTASKSLAVTKKDQICALFTAGIWDVNEIAVLTQSRPSYVANVLQEANLMTGYFDLYTSSSAPMNVYSPLYAKRLAYKDVESAKASVDLIDAYYRVFAADQDRAGQHHALVMALTMFDRARWSNKPEEAGVFRKWLLARLKEEVPPPPNAPRAQKKSGNTSK